MRKLILITILLISANWSIAQISGPGRMHIGKPGLTPKIPLLSPYATSMTPYIVDWWRLEETAGTRFGEKGNNLTDVNNTGFGTGKIGNGSYHLRAGLDNLEIADFAGISIGAHNFCLFGWVRLDTTTVGQSIFSKRTTSGSGNFNWELFYNNGTQRFQWYVSDATTNLDIVTASNFGNGVADAWHFVMIWRDSTANTINISINNGTPNSATLAFTPIDGTAKLRFGCTFDVNTSGFQGELDEVGIIKHYIPSANERAYLYNSGLGRTYINGIVL